VTTLSDAAALARADRGLAVEASHFQLVLVDLWADWCGPCHFLTPVLTKVVPAYDGRVKLANLRARPQLAVTFRDGWQWATVEGRAELAGPDDPVDWLDGPDRLRLLLREVFTACGGTHDDWDAYDRTMVEQRRAAVLVDPSRVYSNG